MILTAHAQQKAIEFGLEDVRGVYNDPDTTYPSLKYPHQEKRVGKGLCLCVEKATGKVVTIFRHSVETALRPDQKDAGALAWASRRR